MRFRARVRDLGLYIAQVRSPLRSIGRPNARPNLKAEELERSAIFRSCGSVLQTTECATEPFLRLTEISVSVVCFGSSFDRNRDRISCLSTELHCNVSVLPLGPSSDRILNRN